MILFLTAVILSLVSAQRTCMNNGLMGPTGDKCYHFISALQNFDDAEVVCGMFDSVLVSVTSGLESNFILDNAHERLPGEYWIGLTDLYSENVWRWMDGQVSSYTNWGTGFPKNDTTKQCVAAQWSGKWMNVNCSTYSAYFICESIPPTEYGLTRCPPNGIEGLPGCFIINVVPETYKNAEVICGEFGGNLAEVVNAEQALNLMSVAKERFYKTDYWIGVSDPYDTGVWQFIDGTPINFTHWAVGYPEKDEKSLYVASRLIDGKWYNTDCDNKKSSVCQQKFETPSNEWLYFAETDSFYKGYRNATGRISEYEQTCKDQGAHLVSIHSFQENMFVATTVLGKTNDLYVAIGVYFNSSKNGLTWMDGTPWGFEFWYTAANKATAAIPCAVQLYIVTYTLTWAYDACDQMRNYHFVCKRPRVSM